MSNVINANFGGKISCDEIWKMAQEDGMEECILIYFNKDEKDKDITHTHLLSNIENVYRLVYELEYFKQHFLNSNYAS